MPRAARLALTTVLATLAASVGAGAALAPEAGAARFDTRVLALIPTPGFPARAYGAPNGRVYEGTYDNPSGDTVPSRVFEYTAKGALLRSWTVRGQNLSAAHGVQVATVDGSGRLVLLDKSPARVLLLDRTDGNQTTYATFPAGAVPNYAAWGPDGSLYVTDYESPVVYRVPPGGGTPVEWLRDPLLAGGQFGATGIALKGDRSGFLIGVQSGAGATALVNPTAGRLLSVPLAADGKPGPVSTFWESQALDAPDGFAIARSGAVYVALLLANRLAVIGPDGKEVARGGANGSPVPFDNPSNASFVGDRVVVANQAFVSGDVTHQAILSVDAGETGLPELIPPGPAAPAKKAATPAKKKPAAKKKKKKKKG